MHEYIYSQISHAHACIKFALFQNIVYKHNSLYSMSFNNRKFDNAASRPHVMYGQNDARHKYGPDDYVYTIHRRFNGHLPNTSYDSALENSGLTTVTQMRTSLYCAGGINAEPIIYKWQQYSTPKASTLINHEHKSSQTFDGPTSSKQSRRQ